MSFLYFRDHPREYQLALEGKDIWEHTRPKSVLAFLKKLPEYRGEPGLHLLSSCDNLYSDLSSYTHPRSVSPTKYLSDYKPEDSHHKTLCSGMRNLAKITAGLLALSDHDVYVASSEIDRALMRSPVEQALWRSISKVS